MTRQLYNNLTLSETTIQRRSQIKKMMDEFMDFQWRDQSAFENFGAFIINDKKGSLKFYNGPGFSNEYSKPQFDSNGGELMGVNFNKQTISFTIGVYWISIEHYRLLMDWLNPLVTNYIIFGFESKYRYNVKLSKRGDSTRWVVGHEMVNGVKTPMYYTELALTFELQGAQCARGVYSYEFKPLEYNTEEKFYFSSIKITDSEDNILKEFTPSDLPTPIDCSIELPLYDSSLQPSDKDIFDTITLTAIYQNEYVNLFTLTLANLTYSNNSENYKTLYLKYNSETGLVFLKYGDNNDKIITSLSTTDTGEKIVNAFTSNKFNIPGKFDYFDFWNPNNQYQNLSEFILSLSWSRMKNNGESTSVYEENAQPVLLTTCYPRTNII